MLHDLVLGGALRLLHPEPPGDLRRQQRGIADRGEIDEDDFLPGHERELRGRGEGEARLSRPARPGQGDEPHVVATEQRVDRDDLEVAPEQRCRRRRQGHDRLRLWRGEQRRVLVEDALLERLQLGTRVDPELVDERPLRRAIGVERVLLPAGAVEGEHELRVQPFAVGMLGDQRGQAADELVALADSELRVVRAARAR